MSDLTKPLQYLQQNFDRFLTELSDYARIPSVSFPGFPPEPVRESAEWTARRMAASGLENVRLLEVEDAPPYVYGDWLHADGAPTLLLYAHHDVQPPGRRDKWLSPPFEPTRRGDRLYGRGVVDDKAGGMLHMAALEAYLKTWGKLPVNIRFIVEGEEECGSGHLAEFLKQYAKLLQCDVMVLTDTANLESGLPSITYSLRGIVDCIVEVQLLDHPVHSGMWGGPGPEALSALTQILARLNGPNGKINIPELYQMIPPLSKQEQSNLARLPFNEKQFCADLGSVPSLKLAGESEYSVYERIWTRPALSILGIDAPTVQDASNQLLDAARAKVSLRIVPGMDPKKSLKLLCDFLAKDPPYGAQVKVIPGAAGDPWKIEPSGPAFAAAERALEKGFACKPVYIGCGGSIPFVEPLVNQFGGIPALLIGLEDPVCCAHGENESLLISDWQKGIRSAIYLYAEKFR